MVIEGMENNYEEISLVGFCYLLFGVNVSLFASEHKPYEVKNCFSISKHLLRRLDMVPFFCE